VPVRNVLIQGYSNDYSQYVTTPEAYDSQQYEGRTPEEGRKALTS
jgi:neutral ceramidase